jgi:hypothetical protein
MSESQPGPSEGQVPYWIRGQKNNTGPRSWGKFYKETAGQVRPGAFRYGIHVIVRSEPRLPTTNRPDDPDKLCSHEIPASPAEKKGMIHEIRGDLTKGKPYRYLIKYTDRIIPIISNTDPIKGVENWTNPTYWIPHCWLEPDPNIYGTDPYLYHYLISRGSAGGRRTRKQKRKMRTKKRKSRHSRR